MVIILQHIQISNHYTVYPKQCYRFTVTYNKKKKKEREIKWRFWGTNSYYLHIESFFFFLFITYKTLVVKLYFVFLRNPGKIHITGLVVGAGGRNNNENMNTVPLRVVYVDHLITYI